jgi:hypothetical protein
MKRRRVIVAGAGALAVVGLSLSGCIRPASAARGIGVLTSAPVPSASPSAVDGTDAFDTAMISLDRGYDVTVTYGGLTATGRMDPGHHAATIDFAGLQDGVHGDVAFTQISSAVWMKIDLGTISRREGIEPKIWYRLAQSKISGADSLPFDLGRGGDPLDVTDLFSSVADVRQTDSTHVTGTVDLSQADGSIAPDPADVDDAGAAARAEPFTLVLDDGGRPAHLHVSGNHYLAMDFAFSHVGSPSPVKAPSPSNVRQATAAVYQFFG